MTKTVRYSRGNIIRSHKEVTTFYVVVSRDDYNILSSTHVLVPMQKREVSNPFDIYSKRFDMVVASTSPSTLEMDSKQYSLYGVIEKKVLSEILENLMNLLKSSSAADTLG